MAQTTARIRHPEHVMVPKVLAIAMFGLMFATVALVAFATLTDRPKIGVLVEQPVLASRQVILTGDRAGTYTVHDLDGTQLAISSANKAGFIGVVGRTFDRERLSHGVTEAAPLTVLRRENGTIAIRDDTTGLSVDLIGYGKDNVAAFGRLLD